MDGYDDQYINEYYEENPYIDMEDTHDEDHSYTIIDDDRDEGEEYPTYEDIYAEFGTKYERFLKKLIKNRQYLQAQKFYDENEDILEDDIKRYYEKNMPDLDLLDAFANNEKSGIKAFAKYNKNPNKASKWLLKQTKELDNRDPILLRSVNNQTAFAARYNDLKDRGKLTNEDIEFYNKIIGRRQSRELAKIRADIKEVRKQRNTEEKLEQLKNLAAELAEVVGDDDAEYIKVLDIISILSNRLKVYYAVCQRPYENNEYGNYGEQQLIIRLSPASYSAYINGATNFSYITKRGDIGYFYTEKKKGPYYGNNTIVSMEKIEGLTSAGATFGNAIIEYVDTYANVGDLTGDRHFIGRELIEFDKFISVESDGFNCIDNFLKSIGSSGEGVQDLDGFTNICSNLNVEIYNPDLSLYRRFGTGEHQVIYTCNHLYLPKTRLNGITLGEISCNSNFREVKNVDKIIDKYMLNNRVVEYSADRSKIVSFADDEKLILTKPMPLEKRLCEKFGIKFVYQSVKAIADEVIKDNRRIYSNPYHDKMMDDLKTVAYAKTHITKEAFLNLNKDTMLKLDIKRCYSNILKTWKLPNNNNWINWRVVDTDKYIGTGFYYITEDINEYFKANSWVWSGVIKKFNACVKYYIAMEESYVDIKNVDDICNGDDDEKIILNTWIGGCGYTGKAKKLVVSNDLDEVGMYLRKDNLKIKKIGDFREVVYSEKKPFYEHARYFYYAIIQIGRYMLYKQECDIKRKYPNCRILEQITDSTLFIKGSKIMKVNLDYKSEKIPDEVGNYHGYNYFKDEPQINDWIESEDYRLILGPAGSGKTTELRKKTGYEYYAATNSAAANVSGETLSSLMRMIPKSSYSMLKFPYWANTSIIVDECSQLDNKMLCILATLKARHWDIILSGDFKQSKPVNGDYIADSPVLGYLCNWKRKILTKIHRFNNETFAAQIRDYKFPKLLLGGETRMNLCYTHKMEKIINDSCNLEPYYRLPLGKKLKVNGINITTDFIFERVGDELIQVFSPNKLKIKFSNKFVKTNTINYHRAQGLTINVPHTLHELNHPGMTDELRYVGYSRTTAINLIFGKL